MSELIKLIIADDHKMVRKAWKLLLEDELDIEVIGEADNGSDAIKLLETVKADIILMDVDMPGMDGIEATRIIQNRFPWVKVVSLTMHKEKAYVEKLLSLGAYGYLTKSSPSEELVLALRTVIKGEKYICEEANYRTNPDQDQSSDPVKQLTTREIEIIKLIASGLKTKDIANQLFLSIKTVEAHRSNIFKKLNVKNVAELLSVAREKALIY